MIKLSVVLLLVFLCELACADPDGAATNETGVHADSVWLPIINSINEKNLDTLVLPISDKVISHVDFSLSIDTGVLYLFKPIELNGKPHYYGGYFVGEAQMDFRPRISTEREQMQRFFETDSISIDVRHAGLLFSETIFDELNSHGLEPSGGLSAKNWKVFDDATHAMKSESDFYSPYMTLKILLHPREEPALHVTVVRGKLDQIQYSYNPFAREEVSLGQVHPESYGVESVCSYSRFADETFANINGQSKQAILPRRYEIDASIDDKGMLRASVKLEAEVTDPCAQFSLFYLRHNAEVESVETGDGTPVEFIREKRESLRSALLIVLLPEPPSIDSPLVLRFKYHGDIAKRDLGLFWVNASTMWYPRFGASLWSDFEMHFKTPEEFTLIASASLVDSSTVGDTLFTHWHTERPEKGVTFNIAAFEMKSYAEEDLPEVELYHNKPLHKAFLKTYREDWSENMSESILNSLRLFSSIYGPPIREKFRVTEILYSLGESFPGFINLYLGTYANQNVWGEDMMFRAHEVAHQWWGSTVGYETYHDQWLSEGLATYSSLRYCHTVVEHKRFLEKLREIRDQVYYARRGQLYSGAIIQGVRAESSKAKGDAKLVTYDKAALVMHMLRCHLTDWNTLDDSRFNDLLKAYFQKYAGRNATTQDFRNLLEERTGIDWGWFFQQWIYGNDLPEYSFHKEIKKDESDGVWRAKCIIEQREVGPDFTVIMPIEIEFDKDRKQYTAIIVRGDTKEFTLTFEEKPKKVRLNPFEAVLAKVKQ